MGFVDAVKSVFSQYVGFLGRAMRSEYWYWILFTMLAGIAAAILDVALFPHSETSPLSSIAELIFLLPSWAVGVRRLHDVGRSGWWQLLFLVPVIGWIVLFVWSVTKGDATENRFGPPPLPTSASPATA